MGEQQDSHFKHFPKNSSSGAPVKWLKSGMGKIKYKLILSQRLIILNL